MTNDIRYGGLLGLPRQTSPDGNGGILGRLAPPAEEPWSNLWPINAGGAWPPPTLGLDAYLSPLPPPSWDSIPAPATAAQSSPIGELAEAEDARRVAAERLRRGVVRPAAAQPSGSELPPDFYLSPVPRAPSWEQIGPTATPWSVAPKLPSAMAWGDTIAGHECHASAGKLDCITPGARRFSVPAAEDFPERLRFAAGEPYYHSYSTPDGPAGLDPGRVMQGVIDRPTVGPVGLVRPATPEGTLNEATPATLYHILRAIAALKAPLEEPPTYFNPVKSYLTTDQNGTPMVVNVTQPGHGLSPGIVNRYVTTSPSGSTIQNEGTGLGLLQGPSKLGYFRDWISGVWKGQAENIIKQSQRR